MTREKALRIVAVVVVIFGIVLTGVSVFGVSREEHRAEFGGISVEYREKETLGVPVWLGPAIAAAGAGLLLTVRRR